MQNSRKRKSDRLRKNMRSFKKKKIDYSMYVKDFYLENGLAYISCNVRSYFDVIDKFSVNGYEWLDEEFARFVESNAYYIPVEYPIVLEICGGKFSKKQQDSIVETIADYYSLKLGDKQIDLDHNRNKILWFFVFGLALFGVVLLFNWIKLIGAVKEVICILFWFFIWEMGDLIVYERMDMKRAKTDMAQLASIKVMFNDKFTDKPDDEAVVEEIISEVFQEES